MTVLIEERRYSPDDLVTLRDAEHCELLNGRLVEKNMGTEAAWIGLRLGAALSNHVLSHDSGWVFGAETGYLCFGGNRDRVRKPDVSFVLRSRLARIPKGHIQVVPDLAVEVVSPNDLFSKVQVKVKEYLHASVQMVWVVEPDTWTIVEYFPSGEVHRLRDSDTLCGGSVLPGFSCSVATLFPPKEAVESGMEEVIP